MKINEIKITTDSRRFLLLTLEGAMKILNVDNFDPEKIRRNYEYIFIINNKAKGSSLYLQSNIFFAKERIDMEMRSK